MGLLKNCEPIRSSRSAGYRGTYVRMSCFIVKSIRNARNIRNVKKSGKE